MRIAVVDTYDGSEPESRLKTDLSQFDSTFSLPTPNVSYNYPVPGPANLNSTSTGWGLEEALDLEWSHASGPGASIAMTFSPNSGVGLYEAVDWLVSNHLVDVISLSWGEPDVGVFNAWSTPCSVACNASSDGSYELLGPVLEAAALEGISVFVGERRLWLGGRHERGFNRLSLVRPVCNRGRGDVSLGLIHRRVAE